jgi:hypothetical protein
MPLKREIGIDEWQAIIKEVRAIVETNGEAELHEYVLRRARCLGDAGELTNQFYGTHSSSFANVDCPFWLSFAYSSRILTLPHGASHANTPAAIFRGRQISSR